MDKMTMEILGKTITIYRRPESDKLYYYFSHDGRKYKGSTGVKDFQNIRPDQLTIMVVNVIQGKEPKKKVKAPYTLTMAYKEFYKYKKELGIADRTLYDYQRKSKYLLECLGKKDVSTLGNVATYRKYQNWKLNYFKNNPDKQTIKYHRNGKVVNGRTFTENGRIAVDWEIKFMVMILRWCQKIGKIPRDIHIDQYEEYKGPRDETRVLSKDEYGRIKAYMMKDNPLYGSIVSFVNNTGIRYPGEMTPLKWKHIDFNKHTISIVGRKRGSNRGRTRVDTLIPMTNRVKDILLWLKSREGISTNDDDYIFINTKGERVMNIIKYWKKTLRHLEIDDGYTMYSLRHLFAVRMIKRPDIPIKMISEWMGHSTTHMLERTYARWIDIDAKVKTALESEKVREELLHSLNK